jgi:hydroxypyruvate isomerase
VTTRSRFIAAGSLVVVVAAFLAGLWPERQRRTALDADNASLRARVETLDDYARLAQLHAHVLNLIDAVAEMNYGQAQTFSSTLFDNVRTEASRTRSQEYRTTLEAILSTRDNITGALARGDAATLEPLRRIERQLRQALANPPAVAT